MTGFLIIAGAGPLAALATAESLDVLFLPNLRVIVPDMVRQEVIEDLSRPEAGLVADWIRCNDPGRLTVASTETFEEFVLLRSLNPRTQLRNRSELAAAEVLGRGLVDQDFGAVLLFEDGVRKTNFLTRLPDRVVATSTSEFLFELERRGLLQGTQSILDQAALYNCL